MENNISMENNSSLFAVIGGACGIILLCVYILWGSDHKDASAVKPEQQIEIQQEHTEPIPAEDRR